MKKKKGVVRSPINKSEKGESDGMLEKK